MFFKNKKEIEVVSYHFLLTMNIKPNTPNPISAIVGNSGTGGGADWHCPMVSHWSSVKE